MIKRNNIDFFAVPAIHDSGEHDGKFYYLSDFYPGPLLATKNPPRTDRLESWLDKIAAANSFILAIDPDDLRPGDSAKKEITDQDWADKFRRVESWQKEVPDANLEPLLEAVKKARDTYTPAIKHGDFVPWHMIEAGDKFILIDAEHCSPDAPRYVDIAYFYHRLYTSGQNPELADKYLKIFRARLACPQQAEFDRAIVPILAERIIGGYWDAKTDDVKDTHFHDRLKVEFIKNYLTGR
jgi:hypothetical protein